MKILDGWPAVTDPADMMLFNLEQTAVLCGLKPRTLSSWVLKGAVAPACRGGVGRGKTHCFSCPQVFGLAWAAAVSQCPWGCSLRYIKKLLAGWQKLDDATLDAMTRRGGVAYSEETYAKWYRMVFKPSMGVERCAVPHVMDEDEKAVVEDILARMKRVQMAIIHRKEVEADRATGRVAVVALRAQRLG